MTLPRIHNNTIYLNENYYEIIVFILISVIVFGIVLL